MLANLRRKIGLTPGGMTPMPQGHGDPTMMAPPPFIDPSIVPPPPSGPFTMEELGMPWPHDRIGGMFSPSSIPLWLQEQVCLTSHFDSDSLSAGH